MISLLWAWREIWTVHSEKTSSKNLSLTPSILRGSARMSWQSETIQKRAWRRSGGSGIQQYTLFPSRPLDTRSHFVFVAGSVIRDQGALARAA